MPCCALTEGTPIDPIGGVTPEEGGREGVRGEGNRQKKEGRAGFG